MFLLHTDSPTAGRIYGVFTTVEKAKDYVKDVLGVDVEWSDPKNTVIGSMRSRPRTNNNFHIKPLPVDPTTFENLPIGI